MIVQPNSIADFRLPTPCVDLATQLGSQFGLPSHLLLACFPVAIGLTAGTCRLDTGIWLALANILAPILDIVDLNPEVRAHPYSKEAGLVKEETLIIRDSIREPELSSRSGLPIPDTQIQQPALMTENLKPGQLMRVTKKFPGRFVLACYDDASFVQLIEKARSRAEKDLMLLQSGWAKSLEAPSILGMAEPHVQVEVSCLAVCYQPALGRFVVSNKALVNRLADQFILLAAEKSSSIQCPVDWTQRTNCLRAWKELARRIVNACNSTENLIIGMTAEASKLLMEYLREATRRDGVRSSDHLCSEMQNVCWPEFPRAAGSDGGRFVADSTLKLLPFSSRHWTTCGPMGKSSVTPTAF